MFDNFEKLSTLDSEKKTKLLLEYLSKAKIEAKEKISDDKEQFEIWVPSDKMFAALGITAEFEKDMRDLESKMIKAGKKPKANSSVITVLLVLFIITITSTIIIQINKSFNLLNFQMVAIKEGSKNIDLSELSYSESDLKELFESSKNVKYSKFSFSLKPFFFKRDIKLAEKNFNQENYKKSEFYLEKALLLDRSNISAISLLVRTYLKISEYQKAKVLLKESSLIDNSTWKKWAVLQLADIYLSEDNYFGAELELSTYLKEINGSDTDILLKLAETYSISSNKKEAEYISKNILAQDNLGTDTLIKIGYILYNIGSYTEATKILAEIYYKTDTHPELANISLLLAEMNLTLHKLKDARNYLDQSQFLEAESSKRDFLEAEYSYLSGDTERARALFESLSYEDKAMIRTALFIDLIDISENKLNDIESHLDSVVSGNLSPHDISFLEYVKAAYYISSNDMFTSWLHLEKALKTEPLLLSKFGKDFVIKRFKKSEKYKNLLNKYDTAL